MDDKQREMTATHKRLKENGTMDRLQQRLLADLLNDPGWMLAIRESVRDESVRESQNVSDDNGETGSGSSDLMELTMEDIVAAIVPAGKEAVPTALQEKFMALIQKAVKKEDYNGRRDVGL
jgi:hypothetical protein